MKKLHSLFILSILVLTMFVGCQNPTDGTGNGNTSSGGDDTPITYTLVGEEDNAAKYVLDDLPTTDNPSEYAEGDTVTFSIKTKNGETPTGLYLVKVTIKKRYIGDVLDIPVTYNKENHTVSFKMPNNDVMVRADFEDVVFEKTDANSNLVIAVNDVYSSSIKNFDVGLYFDTKDFDNLKPIDNKFVFLVAKKEDTLPEGWSDTFGNKGWYYLCKITSTAKNYKFCAVVGEKVFPSLDGQIDINFVN